MRPDRTSCTGRVTRRRFLGDAALGAAGALACRGARAAGDPAPGDPPEAAFYEPLPGRAVRCRLCPLRCEVPEGGRGRCRVRENRGGRYVSLSYGRPVAANTDPIEKKPLFHVLPGSKAYSLATVGCNIACKFCQNWDISQASPEDVSPPFTPPASVARAAVAAGARAVAYTYSEPVVFYEYVRDCAAAARQAGVGSVMVSNGFIEPEPLAALVPQLTAVKIDLKAFTARFYEEVCGGRLQPVLDTLKRLRELRAWFEIVTLLIPTLNDDADDIRRLAAWTVRELGPDVPLHFTRFHPDYKLKNIPPTPPRTLEQARAAAMAEGCRFVYTGNMPGNEGENTYCPSCKAAIIRRYHFTLLACEVVDGKCGRCGAVIPGVWS